MMVEVRLIGPLKEVEKVIEGLDMLFKVDSNDFDGWNEGQAQHTVLLSAEPPPAAATVARHLNS